MISNYLFSSSYHWQISLIAIGAVSGAAICTAEFVRRCIGKPTNGVSLKSNRSSRSVLVLPWLKSQNLAATIR